MNLRSNYNAPKYGGDAIATPAISEFQSRLKTAIDKAIARPTLYTDPVQSNQGNAQYVYGERLSALFGTCVVVEGSTDETVFFSVYADHSFACNVSNVTVVGVRNERFQMSMTLIDLSNQEAVEEAFINSGI